MRSSYAMGDLLLTRVRRGGKAYRVPFAVMNIFILFTFHLYPFSIDPAL